MTEGSAGAHEQGAHKKSAEHKAFAALSISVDPNLAVRRCARRSGPTRPASTLDYPTLRVVRLSGEPFTARVEERSTGGVTVRVYNPAKTVADCFKFRSKVGLDVAPEALHDCWRKTRATMQELWHYAKVCRVSTAMRPYLESLPA